MASWVGPKPPSVILKASSKPIATKAMPTSGASESAKAGKAKAAAQSTYFTGLHLVTFKEQVGLQLQVQLRLQLQNPDDRRPAGEGELLCKQIHHHYYTSGLNCIVAKPRNHSGVWHWEECNLGPAGGETLDWVGGNCLLALDHWLQERCLYQFDPNRPQVQPFQFLANSLHLHLYKPDRDVRLNY